MVVREGRDEIEETGGQKRKVILGRDSEFHDIHDAEGKWKTRNKTLTFWLFNTHYNGCVATLKNRVKPVNVDRACAGKQVIPTSCLPFPQEEEP